LDSPTTGLSTDLGGHHETHHPVTVALESLTVRVAGRELLSNVTLEVLPGMITVIVGGSGAGKSVLLRILGGLVDAGDLAISQSGKIIIGARRGDGEGDSESLQPQASARVGIVFQNFALFDQWSPKGNVQLAIDHRSDLSVPPEQSASGWLEELRVPQSTPVAVLSGGQKQRLAIARTLAAAPAIVLYDEPTSGLDSASGRQVAELIRRTQASHRRTSIVVTHDYQTLLPIADDVLLLDSASKTLTRVPKDQWDTIAQRMQPVRQPAIDSSLSDSSPPSGTTLDRIAAIGKRILSRIDHQLTATGAAVLRTIDRVINRNSHANNRRGLGMIRPWWISRFFGSFLRLVGGPSAMVYLAVAGMIVGFTATYFTFEFLPYRIYSKPLLIEDLLAVDRVCVVSNLSTRAGDDSDRGAMWCGGRGGRWCQTLWIADRSAQDIRDTAGDLPAGTDPVRFLDSHTVVNGAGVSGRPSRQFGMLQRDASRTWPLFLAPTLSQSIDQPMGRFGVAVGDGKDINLRCWHSDYQLPTGQPLQGLRRRRQRFDHRNGVMGDAVRADRSLRRCVD